MMSRTIVRRLKRLEAELAPPSDEPLLTIVVTRIGSTKPDRTIELRGIEPADRRRPWQRYGGRTR